MIELVVKSITGRLQKAQLKELQLICLPEDDPIHTIYAGCSLALYDKRRMVAFGMARPSIGYADTLYLTRAGVHPEYQGQGLQKRLIQLREAWALAHGLHYAITDTANTSAASMCSLISSGYRPFDPQMVEPWALERSVYWKKQLTQS